MLRLFSFNFIIYIYETYYLVVKLIIFESELYFFYNAKTFNHYSIPFVYCLRCVQSIG